MKPNFSNKSNNKKVFGLDATIFANTEKDVRSRKYPMQNGFLAKETMRVVQFQFNI